MAIEERLFSSDRVILIRMGRRPDWRRRFPVSLVRRPGEAVTKS
jgi:hypothetical protein